MAITKPLRQNNAMSSVD